MKKISFTFKYNVAPSNRKAAKTSKINLPMYPLIPVTFYYKGKKTPIIEALIDSGSDRIYLHKAIAEDLNLPMKKRVESSGMGGKYISYETKVGVIIGRGGRRVDFGLVEAIFPEKDRDVPLLIGRVPIFEEYQVIFEEYKKQVRLIPIEEVIKKKTK